MLIPPSRFPTSITGGWWGLLVALLISSCGPLPEEAAEKDSRSAEPIKEETTTEGDNDGGGTEGDDLSSLTMSCGFDHDYLLAHGDNTVEKYIGCTLRTDTNARYEGVVSEGVITVKSGEKIASTELVALEGEGHHFVFPLKNDDIAEDTSLEALVTVDGTPVSYEIDLAIEAAGSLLSFTVAGLDFGILPVGGQKDLVVAVEFTGTYPVTLTVPTLASSFTFKGGTFPGEGGDCTMVVTEPCTMGVEFSSVVPGVKDTTLALEYFNGLETITISQSWEAETRAIASQVFGQVDFSENDANQVDSVAATTLNEPGGVFYDGTRLFVADTNNHRVLIWNQLPELSANPGELMLPAPDVVLGQPDFVSNSANQGGGPTASTLNNPTGLYSDGSTLFVADSFNNRVLVWNPIPTTDPAGTAHPATGYLGTSSFTNGLHNIDGGAPKQNSMRIPSGISGDGTRLVVGDRLNNRVLIWNDVSTWADGANADHVLGQGSAGDPFTRADTLGGAGGLAGPMGVVLDGQALFVADFSNHRVVKFDLAAITNGEDGVAFLGQADASGSTANRGLAPSGDSLSSPIAVAVDGGELFAADWGNHRILQWNALPATNGISADAAIGQAGLEAADVNGGGQGAWAGGVQEPTGSAVAGDFLIVTDKSNHRLLVVPLP